MQSTRTAIGLGVIGQAVVLARIAGLAADGSVALVVAAVVLAVALARAAPRTASMIAWGGFGMTLGWWADLGFQSATEVARFHGIDALWCRTPAIGAFGHELPGVGHLASWMNVGMILFGTPAVIRCVRPASVLRCTVGMILGMGAGSLLAARVASGLAPTMAVFIDYIAMSAGMWLGMAAIERVPGRRDQMPRKAAIATSPQPTIVTRNPAAPA
jgi:hypothetical protein